MRGTRNVFWVPVEDAGGGSHRFDAEVVEFELFVYFSGLDLGGLWSLLLLEADSRLRF